MPRKPKVLYDAHPRLLTDEGHGETSLLDLLQSSVTTEMLVDAAAADPGEGALPEEIEALHRHQRAIKVLGRTANAVKRMYDGGADDHRSLVLATAGERQLWRTLWGLPAKGRATHPCWSPVAVLTFMRGITVKGGTIDTARRQAQWSPKELAALRAAQEDPADVMHHLASWVLNWAERMEGRSIEGIRGHIWSLMDCENPAVALNAAKLAHGIVDPAHTPGITPPASANALGGITINAAELIVQIRQGTQVDPLPDTRPRIILEGIVESTTESETRDGS